jgi:predicted transposase YdaD
MKSPTHDTSYKILFSCPEMVRDLLRGYVPGDWLEDADYASLTRVNASYVSRSGQHRHDDMVWRIKVGGRWLWVYIILEFQSEPDPWMAVRVMQYVSMLAEQLVKERGKSGLPEGLLPPVLPIVLYNGKTEWRVPVDVADCFLPPPRGLAAYRPALQYLLLDERRLQQYPLVEVHNFADAVFRMESCRGLPELDAVARALRELLRTPELQSLRHAFNQWIKALLRRRATPSMIEEVETIDDILEEFAMLTQHQETWFDDAIEKGFLQGQEKGLEKGLEKGRTEALMTVARNLLGLGRSVEEVVQVTGLSPKEIQTLLH